MNQAFQYQRLILAYHGCDKSVADRVLMGDDTLKKSEKSYDWLGSGIYFWEHCPERALEWAHGRENVKNPTVVGAIIHLGNCFDLLDRKATKLLSEVYPDFLDGMRGLGQKIPKNESLNPDDRDFLLRRLDCSVLNWALGSMDQNHDSPVLGVRNCILTFFTEIWDPIEEVSGSIHARRSADPVVLSLRSLLKTSSYIALP